MDTKILASIVFTGDDFDPEEITSYIGLKPSKIWYKGEKIQNSAIKRKKNGWLLSTGREISLDLDIQIREITDSIKPHISKIIEICQKFNLETELSCAIYIEDDKIPSIHFEKDILKIISDLKAEIDIDIYM